MKFTYKSPILDWETLLKSQDFVKEISEMQILREIRKISYQGLKNFYVTCQRWPYYPQSFSYILSTLLLNYGSKPFIFMSLLFLMLRNLFFDAFQVYTHMHVLRKG
jgi:hypothetical protein